MSTARSSTLVAEHAASDDAVKAGKLAEAQEAYAPAHQHYERIEPIAELFNDLDGSHGCARGRFREEGGRPEVSSASIGSRRALFADKSTAGLDAVADKLMADALDLQKRIDDLTIAPKNMVGGAADLIEEVAVQEDQRRGGPLQPHRSLGLPGQCRRRAEDRRAAQSADRGAGPQARARVCATISPRSTPCWPNTGPSTAGSRATRS